jgi:hypothetical protein
VGAGSTHAAEIANISVLLTLVKTLRHTAMMMLNAPIIQMRVGIEGTE